MDLLYHFSYYRTRLIDWNWNWDAFEDYFRNLDSDSEIVRETVPKPGKIHLRVKNIDEVRKISEKDYQLLLSVLQDSLDKDYRSDNIEFTYELIK
jgi:hypothetical protein